MNRSEIVDLVKKSQTPGARQTFLRRVEQQAEALRGEFRDGDFENEEFTIGLELEMYVVDADGLIRSVPSEVFSTAGCSKELGRHNLEINTPATSFDRDGLEAQEETLRRRVSTAERALEATGLQLAQDAMWTSPPTGGSTKYFSERETTEGVALPEHMRHSPRYLAIDRDILERKGERVEVTVPGATIEAPTILPVSLTTSMQPHLQVPDSSTFAAHYNVGIRTLGPVLALATNSPFLPTDLYGDVSDPMALVEETSHELRIPVFEQTINLKAPGKVRFPRDIDGPATVVDRLLEDRTCAPFLKEWVKDAEAVDEYADRIWELNHKRSTFWRWLRAVPGGEALAGVGEQSLRIEYRPLPTQPTVESVMGFQALAVGLIRGLVEADHPIAEQEWSVARQNFYRVVADGIDADLIWWGADGSQVTDSGAIFDELFKYARAGLRDEGIPEATVDRYLDPIRERARTGITPSTWKKQTVREAIESGKTFPEAVRTMQQRYQRLSGRGEPVVRW